MKKIKLFYIFLLMLFGFGVTSCDSTETPVTPETPEVENPDNQPEENPEEKPEEVKKECTISFNSNGGTPVESQKVMTGSTITKPEDPVRNGYSFDGWTLHGELFDFNKKITASLVLTAKWTQVKETPEITIDMEYYKNVDLTLEGQAFIDSLTKLINTDYKKHSYSYNNTVLAETDSDPNNPNNIICLYTGLSLSSGQWNKEHVWAKSHGFPQESKQAYCDAHHLRPTLTVTNSTRGNLDFDDVENHTGTVKSDEYGNKWIGKVCFEPRDAVKGDVARMMFYMVTKYNNIDGTTLKLVNTVPTTTSTGNGQFGNLETLLEWHYADPVDDWERNRNDIIYKKYQNNRNPYIDYPEFVGIAFGEPDSSVDETKVNEVFLAINGLPSVDNVSLSDETAVNEVLAKYEALTTLEKSKVSNYSKLTSLINKIKELKGENSNTNTDTPVTGTTNVSIDFSSANITTSSYEAGKTIMVNNQSYYFSYVYASSGVVRLGHNKTVTLDSKFGLGDVDGNYLEPAYNIENLKSIQISIGSIYGSGSWVIYFLPENSSSYTKISEGTLTAESTISATLSEKQTGKFILVIHGSKPRADLTTYKLFVE